MATAKIRKEEAGVTLKLSMREAQNLYEILIAEREAAQTLQRAAMYMPGRYGDRPPHAFTKLVPLTTEVALRDIGFVDKRP